MKLVILAGFLMIGLFAPRSMQGQGTLYRSNLDQPSIGSVNVGSDSWIAVAFFTGNNTVGYLLNSIQLKMTDSSGNPSGFTVRLYEAQSNSPGNTPPPSSSLGSLSGSLDPVTGGIYTYSTSANITLLPQHPYYIVLSAETPASNGAYCWSKSAFSAGGGWVAAFEILSSNNSGSTWSPTSYPGMTQFALYATPIPEPSILSLLGIIGLPALLFFRRAKRE